MQQLQATMANKNAWNWCWKLLLRLTWTPQFWTTKWCTPKSTFGAKWSLSWWLWSIHQL